MQRIDKRLEALERALAVDAPPSIFIGYIDEEPPHYSIDGQRVEASDWQERVKRARLTDCVIRIEYVKDWRAV